MQGPSNSDGEADMVAEINIIPLVDVVLVLLIIFMVTTVFSGDSILNMELPKTSAKALTSGTPPVSIPVVVNAAGDIKVNGQTVALEKLGTTVLKLSEQNESTLLVLRGDKAAKYGTIMPVIDELNRTKLKLTVALSGS